MKTDTVREFVVSAPPVSVGGMTLLGFPVNNWIAYATLVWTLFLIIDKMPTVVARLVALYHWMRGSHGKQESRN